MTELFDIQTDSAGVRDFREMRRRLRDGSTIGNKDKRTSGPDKVVEITTSIVANDFDQHDAFLVTLVDGEWVRQMPIKVRKVGAAAIQASAASPFRTIATRIGTSGLCVSGAD